MHQSLGLSRIGFAGSQLGELGLKAWMGRDMDVRRERCHRRGHAVYMRNEVTDRGAIVV